jgi:hypothetical protein
MIEHPERKFEIHTLTPTRFVGLNIVRDRPNRLMYIDQENTVDKMVKDYNMWDCKPSSLPTDPNARLSACSKPKSKEEKEGKDELEEEHTEKKRKKWRRYRTEKQ